MAEIENEPCLVKAGQGFSIVYRQKYLYSKYAPEKAICGRVFDLQILPGTIFLAFSAVLPYGIKELCEKLPENCLVLLCEADEVLEKLVLPKEIEPFVDNPNLIRVSKNELYNLPVILQKSSYKFECGKTVNIAGNFRRVIRIDFSAGVQFHSDFYNRLENACVGAVKQFWTNRFTLAKFGRKYSRNLFSNLKVLHDSKPLSSFIKQIEKPIFVFGAGESAETGIAFIKEKYSEYKYPEKRPFYILCADTAFPMLKGNGIIPDGVVVDEAQSVIAQSFISAKKTAQAYGMQIFQSLCSLPHVAGRKFPKDKLSFYATEYASSDFFESLKGLESFPPVIPAFGSVGITAYILACLFKKDDSVSVSFYGLDFAYSLGKTHGRGTPAHKRQLWQNGRLKGIENFGASFGMNVLRLSQDSPFPFTTPILASYAETFYGVRGQINEITKNIVEVYEENFSEEKREVNEFLLNEKEALIQLRDILSGKTEMSEIERNKEIKSLIENREYLYLHFPDGYKFSMELNFLKRIRGEIDGFLKILE